VEKSDLTKLDFSTFFVKVSGGEFRKTDGLRMSAADNVKQYIGQEYRGRQALCAWVQGMPYPCAGQGRQPCPVKWRSPLRTGYYLSQNAARMAASLPLSPAGKN